MFKGLRGGTVPVYKSLKKNENLSMEEEKEWEKNDDERRQKFDEDNFWRSQYEDQLNGFILDKAQQDEVDRRYSTIQWPVRFTNKYLPMQGLSELRDAVAKYTLNKKDYNGENVR